MKNLITCLLLWILWNKSVDCQCPSGIVGKLPNQAGYTDSGFNRTFLLYNDQLTYEIDCCGYVYQWEIDTVSTGNVFAQIWRSMGGNWTLIGQNFLTVTAGSHTHSNSGAELLAVEANDIIGFTSIGSTVPNGRQKNGGPSFSVLYKDNLHASVGDVETFSDYVTDVGLSVDKTEFSIVATVGPGNPPTFHSTLTSETINDDSTVGSLVMTVTVTDADPGDSVRVTLTSIVPSSTSYTFNETSGQLITSSLLSAGTLEFLFTATDHCGNTATHTFVLTIHNPPPVIHNLPANSSINENTKTESNLYTLNVTDDSANDVITCYIQKTTPQMVDFYVRRTQSETYEYAIYIGANANTHLDFDTAPTIILTTCCTDSKVSVCGNYTVSLIKNHPPVISTLPTTAVDVHIGSMYGTLVYTVTATDPESDSLTYELSSDNECPFIISDSGDILVNGSLSGLNGTNCSVSVFVFDGKNRVGPDNMTLAITGTESTTTTTTTAATAQAANNGLDSSSLSAIYVMAAISGVTCCFVVGVGLTVVKTYCNINRRIKPTVQE